MGGAKRQANIRPTMSRKHEAIRNLCFVSVLRIRNLRTAYESATWYIKKWYLPQRRHSRYHGYRVLLTITRILSHFLHYWKFINSSEEYNKYVYINFELTNETKQTQILINWKCRHRSYRISSIILFLYINVCNSSANSNNRYIYICWLNKQIISFILFH